MVSIRRTRQKKANEYIAECIAATSPGERLPSIRELIEKTDTTRSSVMSALQHYAAKGLISLNPRSGVFRTESLKKSRIIDMIACHDAGYTRVQESFLVDCLVKFCSKAEQHGYAIRMHSVSLDEPMEAYIGLSKLPDSGGFILIQPQVVEMVNSFQKTGLPVVCLFPNGRFPNVDQVKDSASMVSLQMKHLMELGHTRILYLREEDPRFTNYTMMQRRLEYFKLMSKYDFHVPKHWQTECSPGCLFKTLELCFQQEPRPSAIIAYDTDIPIIYDFLIKNNYEIGSDVSVIATDGSAFLRHLIPKPSSCFVDSPYSMELAWTLLEKQMKGNFEPVCYENMLIFHQGDSTGRVNANYVQNL